MSGTLKLIKFSIRYYLTPSMIFGGGKREKQTKSRKLLFSFLGLFLFLYFGAITTFGAVYLGKALAPLGMVDLVPTLFFVAASVFMLITSLFSAQGYLYKAKDCDFLFALPISNFGILCSKLVIMYVFDMIFSILVLVPASAVYIYYAGVSFSSIFGAVVAIFIAPAIPAALGIALSYLVGLLLKYIKHKNYFVVLFSLAAFGGYYYLVYKAGSIIEYIKENAGGISAAIKSYYFPAKLYFNGVKGDVLSLLLLLASGAVIIFAVISLVAPKYRQICANMNRVSTVRNFKFEGSSKAASPLIGAYKKEVYRYFGSVMYFMNTGIMIIIASVACVATLFVNKETILSLLQLKEFADMFTPFICVFLCVAASMAYTSAVSISLEGSSIWIYKSAPIDEKTIFLSKILLNLSVTVPLLIIDAIVVSIGLGLGATDFFMILALPVVFAIFTSISGLIINLLLPKLDFKNETVVIKQSASSLIAIMMSMLLPLSACVLVYVLKISDIHLFALCVGLFIAVLSAILLKVLFTWGVKKFKAL